MGPRAHIFTGVTLALLAASIPAGRRGNVPGWVTQTWGDKKRAPWSEGPLSSYATPSRLTHAWGRIMGWFAISCVIGFLGFLARPKSSNRVQVLLAVFAFTVVLISLGTWALLVGYAHSLGEAVDFIGEGYGARSILGLVLGAGAAFVVEEKTRPPAEVAPPGSEKASRDRAGLANHLVLSVGLGIAFLAITAPHLDRWLTRLTSIKSPVVELQISSSTSHRISITDSHDVYDDVDSLNYLSSYADRLPQDLQYAQKYSAGEPGAGSVARYASALLPAMKRVISPVAKCVQKAIDKGLSVESAREMIRPAARLLEEIIFSEDVLTETKALDEKHEQFWIKVTALPKEVASFVRDQECLAIPSEYHVDGAIPDYFPKIQEYSGAPYLYVAASYFISFMGDDDKALQILIRAKPKLAFEDHGFLWTIARLGYYQGKLGDPSNSYFGPLDSMRAKAHSHVETLNRAYQSCNTKGDLLCREEAAEVMAINTIASYLAEDLARGSSYAIPYTARLQEYAEQIKLLIDKVDGRSIASNAFSTYLESYRYELGDSYAFAVLAIEAQKQSPNYDLLRNKVVPELKRVVEHFEDQLKNANPVNKNDLLVLKTARGHYAAARDLLNE